DMGRRVAAPDSDFAALEMDLDPVETRRAEPLARLARDVLERGLAEQLAEQAHREPPAWETIVFVRIMTLALLLGSDSGCEYRRAGRPKPARRHACIGSA